MSCGSKSKSLSKESRNWKRNEDAHIQKLSREEIRRKNMRLVFAIYCLTIGFVGTQVSAIAAYHSGFLALWDSIYFGMGIGFMIGITLMLIFWGKV